ncbi:polyphosphate polymerase domain-containing protein [Propionicimonas sp.]|uniref:polyphosphate polymerase domain-containing protein n=1 Tax=Propionicimonas sp. TaxID=1955623 RepID=UPI0039E68BDE
MTTLLPHAPTAPVVNLDALPGIGLADLLEQAALQTRVDRKYLVDADRLPEVIGSVDGDLRVLEIDRRREFGYRSTYFDSPHLDGFLRAGRGRRRRFKVRTRTYRESGETWLEVKTRGARGETVKDRLPYELADAGRLTAEGRDFVAGVVAQRGAGAVDVAALAPVLHTSYRRATVLVTPRVPAHRGRPEPERAEPASRVTIDTGLVWRRAGCQERLAFPAQAVVETKGGTRPSGFDHALWDAGIRPSRVSKYGVGLAALDDLPALKWHRIVNDYLSNPPERNQP